MEIEDGRQAKSAETGSWLRIGRGSAVAADIFHDFDRVGGFRQDIGAEIRLTKFFFPQPPSK